jgi:hypothetical protein
MATNNSSPYFRSGNVRSLSSYLAESYATSGPPCCLSYAAGGGHDWTCRISGHAFCVNYEQSDGSTPRPSTTVSSAISSSSTDGNVVPDSIEPLLLPPPAYSAIPRENENIPFLEFPPSYDQIIRANRFHFVRYLPGCARLAYPPCRALSSTQLAALGVHVGHLPAHRSVGQRCAAVFEGDRSWILLLIIAVAFLLGFLLSKFA